MALYKTPAIVLHSAPYRESDVLLTLYTPMYGKVRALAKGVRKPKSRLRGGVQPLTGGIFQIYAGRSLDTITQTQVEFPFSGLHTDLYRWANANYLAELLMVLVHDRDPNPELYSLLASALHLLEESEPSLVVCYFEIRLLSLLGYCPQISHCAACGELLLGQVPRACKDGLLCEECAGPQQEGAMVSREVMSALGYLLRVRPNVVGRLRLRRDALAGLRLLLELWLDQHLERPLKTVTFLRKLAEGC